MEANKVWSLSSVLRPSSTHISLERLVAFTRPGLPFLLPFLLYTFTLAPTIYNLDSAELTTAVATGGLIRATGYPLYLLLGRIWVALIPFGDIGYQLNLFSAFCGAGTLFLAHHILLRWQVKSWARWGALGLLATAPYFWSLSLIAEVYTLHTFLMAGILFTLLRWADQPTPQRLALPVFLAAVSLGNHAATILLIPGCVLFLLISHFRTLGQPRVWLAGIVSLLLGLSIFLYLPLVYASQPVFNYAGQFDATGTFQPVNLQTLDGVLWLITGRTFAGQMFGYQLGEIGSEVSNFLQQLWTAFFAVGLGPGLVGLVALWRKNWQQATLLLLFFLANALFYINYRVVDKNTMFLPAYFIWALWVGVGYQTLLDWLRSDSAKGASHLQVRRTWAVAIRGLLILPVLFALFWNWQRVDLSDDWSTREQSEAILAEVEPNAIVFGWWETVPGVQYLQLVEGSRPDVLAINRFLISGDDMLTLIKDQADQRPIYINSPPLELIQTMDIDQEGDLYRLTPRHE